MSKALMPVVLHHGLFGLGDVKLGPMKLSYFSGIDQAVAERGHPLIVTRVHPSSSVEKRARQLKESVRRQLTRIGRPREKVILIGHSLGGLDARYAVAKLGLASHVAAIVTVTSPHRGSPLADWVVQHLGKRMRGIDLVRFLGLDLQAIHDLTTTRCAAFNEEVTDVPAVRYFSVSAKQHVDRMPVFALHSHRLIHAAEGDNDGMVSVKSSTWGKHLGVWPVDHWHSCNHRLARVRNNSAIDVVPLWVRLLEEVTSQIA
jgi:triacylglycerol lipase